MTFFLERKLFGSCDDLGALSLNDPTTCFWGIGSGAEGGRNSTTGGLSGGSTSDGFGEGSNDANRAGMDSAAIGGANSANGGGLGDTDTEGSPVDVDGNVIGFDPSTRTTDLEGAPVDLEGNPQLSVTAINSILGMTYNVYSKPMLDPTTAKTIGTFTAGLIGNLTGTAFSLMGSTVNTIDKVADLVGWGLTMTMAPVGFVGMMQKVSATVDIAAKYGFAPKEMAFALNTFSTAVSLVSRYSQISQLNAYASAVKSSMPSVATSISAYTNVATGLLAMDAVMFGYNTYMGAQKYGGTSATGNTLGFNTDSSRGGNGTLDTQVVGTLEQVIAKALAERELWFDMYTSLDNLGRILAGGDLYNAGAGSVFYSVSDAFAPFQYMTGIMNPFANKEMDMAINSERYYDGMAGTDTYMTNLLKGNTYG